MKEAASQLKAKVERHESERGRLAMIVASGNEWRMVECYERFDFETGRAHLHRSDTGELVESRYLTTEEMQVPLDLDGDQKA